MAMTTEEILRRNQQVLGQNPRTAQGVLAGLPPMAGGVNILSQSPRETELMAHQRAVGNTNLERYLSDIERQRSTLPYAVGQGGSGIGIGPAGMAIIQPGQDRAMLLQSPSQRAESDALFGRSVPVAQPATLPQPTGTAPDVTESMLLQPPQPLPLMKALELATQGMSKAEAMKVKRDALSGTGSRFKTVGQKKADDLVAKVQGQHMAAGMFRYNQGVQQKKAELELAKIDRRYEGQKSLEQLKQEGREKVQGMIADRQEMGRLNSMAIAKLHEDGLNRRFTEGEKQDWAIQNRQIDATLTGYATQERLARERGDTETANTLVRSAVDMWRIMSKNPFAEAPDVQTVMNNIQELRKQVVATQGGAAPTPAPAAAPATPAPEQPAAPTPAAAPTAPTQAQAPQQAPGVRSFADEARAAGATEQEQAAILRVPVEQIDANKNKMAEPEEVESFATGLYNAAIAESDAEIRAEIKKTADMFASIAGKLRQFKKAATAPKE